MRSAFSAFLAAALCFTGAAFCPQALPAADISFSIPAECEVGSSCYIQNYFDHDPGPGRKDYACGRLSYDGHTGTDIRLRNYPAMRRGTAVLTAAPGVVLRTRDGMPDINVNRADPGSIKGREAGNGVVIDHGNGWVTQYSHLKKGSVAVSPGDRVKRGQKIGMIGLSGNTEFPHVEFAVRYNGRAVDPFVGRQGFRGCGKTGGALWTQGAMKELEYQETGCLTAGLAGDVPDARKARKGLCTAPSPGSPVIVFWVDLFGVMKGDRQEFVIRGPGGKELLDKASSLEESNVSWFAYAGIRRPERGWARGGYTGVYRLVRDGNTVLEVQKTVHVR